MKPEIIKNGQVVPRKIEGLRASVGWDRSEGVYENILHKHFSYYTARDDDLNLVGYVSILSDGIADAFLLDLMVHPDYQKAGLAFNLFGQRLRI